MEPAVLRFITHHFFYFLISQMSNSGDLTSSVEQVESPLLLPGALTAPLVTSGLTARQSNLDMTRHGVYSFTQQNQFITCTILVEVQFSP